MLLNADCKSLSKSYLPGLTVEESQAGARIGNWSSLSGGLISLTYWVPDGEQMLVRKPSKVILRSKSQGLLNLWQSFSL